MSFLKKLQLDKQNKDKFYEEQERLNQQILEVNNLYTIFDGDYLEQLESFNKKYKEENEK